MSKGIHIGEKIQEMVTGLHLSVAEFARKINKSRTSVYHLYKSRSVDSELLSKISEVLEYDFFQCYEKTEGRSIAGEPSVPYGTKNRNLEKEIEQLQEKFEQATREIIYLKKINELLESKGNGKKK